VRIWFVPLEELSDYHLLGQHNELHMLHGILKTTIGWKFWHNKAIWLNDFHARCVAELDFRFDHLKRYQGVHPTPIDFWKLLVDERGFQQEGPFKICSPWKPDLKSILKDQEDLHERVISRKTKFRWTRRKPPEYVF
jgi:hypothetical protein